MPITIHIQSLRDLLEGKGQPWAKEQSVTWKRVGMPSVAILQAGTKSGATSLMIIMEQENGDTVYAEITAKEFYALSSALKGAEERFLSEGDPRPSSN